MELVDGEPLSARLARDGPMAPEQAVQLAAEVADALYHAHQRGIVHRDVKPANILIEAGSGRARLIDFGIAHSLELAAQPLTRTGTTIGTPRYMAPEQLAGEPIGPRTDLWGLGAILYEALTGKPPFDGTTHLAIAKQQAEGPPNMPDVDPVLAALVRDCLAVDIADRPLHAGAVAAALRAWLEASASSAATLTSPRRSRAGPAPYASQPPGGGTGSNATPGDGGAAGAPAGCGGRRRARNERQPAVDRRGPSPVATPIPPRTGAPAAGRLYRGVWRDAGTQPS